MRWDGKSIARLRGFAYHIDEVSEPDDDGTVYIIERFGCKTIRTGDWVVSHTPGWCHVQVYSSLDFDKQFIGIAGAKSALEQAEAMERKGKQ